MKRALVVDDDPRIREIVTHILTKADYEVRSAADGTEALRVFEAWLPDVVILDLGIPEVSGFDVCRQIRDTWGQEGISSVVILSGRNDRDAIEMSAEAGADDYVVKPFSAETILKKVEKALLRAAHRAQDEDNG